MCGLCGLVVFVVVVCFRSLILGSSGLCLLEGTYIARLGSLLFCWVYGLFHNTKAKGKKREKCVIVFCEFSLCSGFMLFLLNL